MSSCIMHFKSSVYDAQQQESVILISVAVNVFNLCLCLKSAETPADFKHSQGTPGGWIKFAHSP